MPSPTQPSGSLLPFTPGRRPPGHTPTVVVASASRPVTDIVGIDPGSGAALDTAGVETVADLWEHAGDRSGRSSLAGQTGLSAERLETWAKHADLMRVSAIGPRHAVLLEAAGVTSLKLLRLRSAEALHERLIEINRSSKFVEIVPTVDQLAGWIERASRIAP